MLSVVTIPPPQPQPQPQPYPSSGRGSGAAAAAALLKFTHVDTIVASVVVTATLALGYILYFLQPVIIPYALASVLAYLFQPVVSLLSHPIPFWRGSTPTTTTTTTTTATVTTTNDDEEAEEAEIPLLPQPQAQPHPRQHSRRPLVLCPRPLAVVLCLLTSAAAFAVIAVLLYHSFTSLQDRRQVYEEGARAFFARLAPTLATLFHVDLDSGLVPFLLHFLEGTVAGTLVGSVYFYLGKSLLVLVFLVYLLLAPAPPADPVESLESIPPVNPLSPSAELWRKVHTNVRRYVVLKTIVSAGVGATVAAIWGSLGVACAAGFGVITFFSNFVPNVGPLFATALPLPVILFDPALSPQAQGLALALPLLVHVISGNFVEPYVVGDSMELHPVVVLLSLIFWSLLWGIPGMILAVPITAVFRIILLQVDHPTAHYCAKSFGWPHVLRRLPPRCHQLK